MPLHRIPSTFVLTLHQRFTLGQGCPARQHHRRAGRSHQVEGGAGGQFRAEHRLEDPALVSQIDGRPQPGTPAAGLPETVDEAEKNRRLARLIELQHGISAGANARWVGREVEALVEGPARRDPTRLYARTRQFKAIVFPDDGTRAGTLHRLRVTGATPVTLRGTPL